MCLTLMKLLLQQQQELQRGSLNSTTPSLPFKLVLMSATMDVQKFTDYFSSSNSSGVPPLKTLHINISRDSPHPVTVHFDHSSVPHLSPDLLPSPMTLKAVILKNMAKQIQNFHFRNPVTFHLFSIFPSLSLSFSLSEQPTPLQAPFLPIEYIF
jgi:HrpA-like RNA helicase